MAIPRELRFELTIAKISRKTHVAVVSGELDPDGERELCQRLSPLANRRGTRLIVDLTNVPFVDSTTLDVLAALAQRLRSQGGELLIASDDPKLGRAIDVRLIGFESSLAGAVERVGSGHAV